MRKLQSLATMMLFLLFGSGIVAQDEFGAEEEAAPAKRGSKAFSVGVGFGLRPDMARTGETITKDGTLDIADGNMMKEVFNTGQVFMGDRVNQILHLGSQSTNSDFNVLNDYEMGGALLGIESGVVVQYDLDEQLDWPMFVRTGFHFTASTGAKQSRTLGDIAQNSATVSGLIQLNGLDPNDFGGKFDTDWSASWYEIPITLGFRVPIKGKSEIYTGLGVSFFRGGFAIDIDMDEKYANTLGTFVDIDNRTVTKYWDDGELKETVEFDVFNIGFHWILGVQSEVTKDLVVFLELNTSGTSRTIYNSEVSAKAQKLLTLSQSETLAQEDDRWFKRFAFPVVLQGAAFRFGAKYYVF